MSFGLGRGRALEPGWWGLSRGSLPPSVAEGGAALDRAWFFPGAARPMELEIGSGKGTFLLQEAARRPETDFLGIEYAGEFFRYAADRLRRHAVSNARLLYVDAVQFLRHWLAPGSVQAIHLYFSDPWPKSRHHKRRVVQDETLQLMHRALAPGGALHLVTDHDDLWTWYEEHASRAERIFRREPFQPPAGAAEGEIVGTNFERKYRREGRPFHAMTLRRIP